MMENIVGSGGGCFGAGTLIQCNNGKTVPIEFAVEGTEVLCYDEHGIVHTGTVTKHHVHSNPEPLIKVSFWRGYIIVTPNHWVLNQYNSFVEVGTLTTEDALVDGMGHLRPITSIEYMGEEAVFNLTVSPHHTFIANEVRVHNGGYRNRFPVVGSGGGGGKGGGGGRVPTEDPDSLQSKQFARVLDLISEGEIVGLVNGYKSVYLDETPLMNNDGSINFSDVYLDFRPGTPYQGYLPGFPTVESENAVSIKVTNSTPIERSITNLEADAVRVTVSTPRLTYQDPSTGDIRGTSLSYSIYVDNGGGFVPARIGYRGYSLITDYTEQGLPSYPATVLSSAAVSNSINYASVEVTWIGENRTPGGYDSSYYFGSDQYPNWWYNYQNTDSFSAVQNVTYTVQYRQLPAGSWEDFATGQFSGAMQSQVGLEWLGDGTWGQTSQYTPPTARAAHAVSLPVEAGYEFRVVKTGGDGSFYFHSGSVSGITSQDTMSGKTSSRYQRAYRIPLTKPGPWTVRVVRDTEDAPTSNYSNDLYWESYTEIIDNKLRYPNSALIALSINAEQFSRIPTRGYEIWGMKVKIPTNYNPWTRTYSGVWDGTFYSNWTDNPAWCFYDLITNKRYGLGEFVEESHIDKWSLYEIAKYCDEIVPNGFGGGEPRFTCNLYLQRRDEAYNVVNQLASIFRGMVYWGAGSLVAVQDAPAIPSALFTASNVIDGAFTYEGSSIKSRHNVALVSWNDPADRYKQKVEYVEDSESVIKNGVVQTDVVAVGCTSRGQAHRLGQWILYSERYETEILSFKTGLEGSPVNPGDVIKVSDPTRAGNRLGGRVSSSSITSVGVDSPIDIEAGLSYTLWSIQPDGTVLSRAVTNAPGEHSILYINPALPEAPLIQSIWVLASNEIEPETWRVISIKEIDSGQVEIQALKYNSSKYNFVEKGMVLDHPPTVGVKAIPDPPENATIYDSIYFNGSNINTKLEISWESNITASRYTVRYRRLGDNWRELPSTTSISVEIANVIDSAVYEVQIWSINALGHRSSVSTNLTHTVLGKLAPPSTPSNGSHSVNLTSVYVTWDDIEDIDRFDFAIQNGGESSTWNSGAPYSFISATTYIIPPLSAGLHNILIKARDTSEKLSTNPLVIPVIIYPPAVPTATITINNLTGYVTAQWQDCTTSHQVDSYEIRLGGNTWDDAIYEDTVTGRSFSMLPDWMGNNTIRIRAKDIAGNWSPIGNSLVQVDPPEAPVVSHSFIDGNLVLTWTIPNSVLPVISYEIRYGATWASGTSVGRTSGTQRSIKANWLGSRNWWVAAIDLAGNVGAAAMISANILSPATPVLSRAFESNMCRLYWTDSATTLPIDYYAVYRGAIPGTPEEGGTSVLLGNTYSTSYSTPVDWSTTATFWVKAVDTAGNPGGYGQLIVSVTPPTVPNMVAQFSNGNCVLSWIPAIASSLPIEGYEVRYGATWETGTLVGRTTDNSISTPADWLGTRTFFIKTYDKAFAYSSASSLAVPLSTYLAPNNLYLTQSLTDLILLWNDASGGSSPISYYEVRYGSDWASGTSIGKPDNNTMTIPITWTGPRTFWVHAVDMYDGVGAPISNTFTVNVPGTLSASSEVIGAKAQLKWLEPVSTLPIVYYSIRYGASWAAGTDITEHSGTDYRAPIDWAPGIRTFWINAVDSNGNTGTAGSTSVVLNIPAAPVVTASVSLDNYILKWNTPTATLPIVNYEIRHGTSWELGTLVGISNTNTMTIKGTWSGNRNFWVAAIDVNGNYGTAGSVTATINPPAAPSNFRQEVVDNNVLLYWNQVQGTMPTTTYEIRKGALWSTAFSIGLKSGGFTTIFETLAGTFTYWIAAVDSAGNIGTPTSISCVVNTPPDYVLKVNTNSTFTGTKVNIVIDNDSMLLPVNTTETFQGHFNNHVPDPEPWQSPNDQVVDGYVIYETPSLLTASYTEIYDHGTTLSAMKITVTPNLELITGTVTPSCTISTSLDGTNWTDYINTLQAFATNFRYVKYLLEFTAIDNNSLLKVKGINLRMDSKLKTATDSINCLAPILGASFTQVGSLITVTASGVWSTGQYITLDFVSGTPFGSSAIGASYNIYRISTGGTGSFQVQATTTTASGTLDVDRDGSVGYLTDTKQHTGQKIFIDVDSIQVSAGGTIPYIALYNFTDTPNPLYMRALLFNTTGTRVSGNTSVTVRGY
jgi:predicted phage tail protein